LISDCIKKAEPFLTLPRSSGIEYGFSFF